MNTPRDSTAASLLRVRALATHFKQRGRTIRAVDGVSFEIARGKTLALVGESGCGKSTLARTILRLIPPSAGQVEFDGLDWLSLPAAALRRQRRRMQVVFQDPYGSLNPRSRVDQIVGEALHVHGLVRSAAERRARVANVLRQVGLPPGALDHYPHEFSGGQRQRIGLARALALEPRLIVLDEPVSALDVSVQAQVLNLFIELQAELGLTYLFVTHNLAVARQIADEVAVMQSGKIVELAPADALFENPRHPYTQALLAAAPAPNPPPAYSAARRDVSTIHAAGGTRGALNA